MTDLLHQRPRSLAEASEIFLGPLTSPQHSSAAKTLSVVIDMLVLPADDSDNDDDDDAGDYDHEVGDDCDDAATAAHCDSCDDNDDA